MTTEAPSLSSLHTVERALDLLELIAAHPSKYGISELAEELGVHKSTISRTISLFKSRGYVQLYNNKYRIGYAMAHLASTAIFTQDIAKATSELGEELSKKINETVNVAILDRDKAINITEATANASIVIRTWIGQVTPSHATSSGKALLSGLSIYELEKILPLHLEQYTPNTITHRDILFAELDQIHQRGFATTIEELEFGLSAVAAPIYDEKSQIVASVSISGPSFRLPRTRLYELAPLVQESAQEMSKRLGYRKTLLS